MAYLRMTVFSDSSRYLRDKYFDIVWGYHIPWGPPPNGPPQKSLTAQARVPVFFDISRYVTDKYFDIVWGATPLETPQKLSFETTQAEVPVFLKYVDI